MPTETKIQSFIHKLEEGGWAKWMRLAVLLMAVISSAYVWNFGSNGFRGLSDAHAIEMAEIGRNIARGFGFTTKDIRPVALAQLRQSKQLATVEHFPDTYHAPLWPALLAPCLAIVRDSWEMTTKDIVYIGDRVVALTATICFLLAILVNYFLARRLFDHRLAILGTGLLLLCAHFWRVAMLGLPQMLMLLIFSGAMYTLLRALERQEEGGTPQHGETTQPGTEETLHEPLATGDNLSALAADEEGIADNDSAGAVSFMRSPIPWLALTGILFGLLALTHGLTIWIFLGIIFFCALRFRPRGLAVGVLVLTFLLLYTPWMVRNYRVSGSAFGVGWYTVLYQLRGSEGQIMRSMEPPSLGSPAFFRSKVTSGIESQLGNLYSNLGGVIAAPFFFIALLHLFRRPATSVFRWCVLIAWLFALFGMAVFGLDGNHNSNDLHILFIPLLTFYGLAFILVMWSRLEIRIRLVQVAFIAFLLITTGYPFVFDSIEFLGHPATRVQWPPYIPPYIAILASWTDEREVIMSDMPWAVAWYADRRSLWIPASIDDYLQLNDWDTLQGRIVGLHLTPVSGDATFLSQIIKGEYKEWAPFIMRNANLRNFPLKAWTALPIEGMCVFYADHDRWSTRED